MFKIPRRLMSSARCFGLSVCLGFFAGFAQGQSGEPESLEPALEGREDIVFYGGFVMSTSRVGPYQKPRPLVGVLQGTPEHADAFKAAGLQLVPIGVDWTRFEPKKGEFDVGYINKVKAEILAFRAAGLQVILGVGIQYPPNWLYGLPNSRYKNQYGDAFVDTRPGMNVANSVFNAAIRERQSAYLKKLFEELGTDFYAVRIGGGWYGELNYPHAEYAGNKNCYWAFDPIAQGEVSGLPDGMEPSPVPGWIPGAPQPEPDTARRFANWYMDSLQHYHDWQIEDVRQWYDGRLMMLYPSWGIRPGQLEAAIQGGLSGVEPVEKNGETQRGFDFERFVAGIEDPLVMLHTTWVDTPPDWGNDFGDNPVEWSPLHFLADLAERHPLNLEVSAENTGGGDSAAVMQLSAERVERFDAKVFLWAFQSDLMRPESPGLSGLSEAFGKNKSSVFWVP